MKIWQVQSKKKNGRGKEFITELVFIFIFSCFLNQFYKHFFEILIKQASTNRGDTSAAFYKSTIQRTFGKEKVINRVKRTSHYDHLHSNTHVSILSSNNGKGSEKTREKPTKNRYIELSPVLKIYGIIEISVWNSKSLTMAKQKFEATKERKKDVVTNRYTHRERHPLVCESSPRSWPMITYF